MKTFWHTSDLQNDIGKFVAPEKCMIYGVARGIPVLVTNLRAPNAPYNNGVSGSVENEVWSIPVGEWLSDCVGSRLRDKYGTCDV